MADCVKSCLREQDSGRDLLRNDIVTKIDTEADRDGRDQEKDYAGRKMTGKLQKRLYRIAHFLGNDEAFFQVCVQLMRLLRLRIKDACQMPLSIALIIRQNTPSSQPTAFSLVRP